MTRPDELTKGAPKNVVAAAVKIDKAVKLAAAVELIQQAAPEKLAEAVEAAEVTLPVNAASETPAKASTAKPPVAGEAPTDKKKRAAPKEASTADTPLAKKKAKNASTVETAAAAATAARQAEREAKAAADDARRLGEAAKVADDAKRLAANRAEAANKRSGEAARNAAALKEREKVAREKEEQEKEERQKDAIRQKIKVEAKLRINQEERQRHKDRGQQLKEEEKQLQKELRTTTETASKMLPTKRVDAEGRFRSKDGVDAVSFMHGASEGCLYLRNKSLICPDKPACIIDYDEIDLVEFQSCDGAQAAGFDLRVTPKSAAGKTATPYTFSDIDGLEYPPMYAFLKTKKLSIQGIEQRGNDGATQQHVDDHQRGSGEGSSILPKNKIMKKNKDAPKGVRTAFNFFTQAECAKARGVSGQSSNQQFNNAALGEEWRGMDEKAKAPFQRQADEDKKRHREEMATYTARKAAGALKEGGSDELDQ